MMGGKGKALIAILGAGKPSDDDEEESSSSSHGPSDTEVSLAKKIQAANESGDAKELARCLKAFIYACDEDEESPDSEKN
jgi:hypothetical protein